MSDRDPLGIVGKQVADKYRIEKLVGEGGFAVVYRAIHTIWNKPVAIKFFNGLSSAPVDQRDQFQQAFIQEGALLTELSSQTAAIVQARDVGTYTSPDGQWMPYMVLEWLEGYALDELLEREIRAGAPPWSLQEVHALLGQAAAALDIAHGKGIAHRDIKPPNLFVLGANGRGPGALVKVLDFGVAKMMSDNTQLKAALAKTGMGVTSFTPQYGAPEQFSRSYGATGPWTDVFALGLVAVEMLTGRPALEGDDIVQLGFSAGNPERRPTPRTLGVAVPDAVEAVFQRALAVKPEQRYARAAEFWAAFDHALGFGGPAVSRAPSATSRAITAPTELAPISPPVRSPSSTTGGGAATTEARPAEGKSKTGLLVAGIAVLGVAAAAAIVLRGGGASSARGAAPIASATALSVASAAPPPSAVPAVPTCPERTAKIPAGQFFQGSDAKDALENEKPSHNVTLSAYCIDLYETTAGEYKTCSDVGKCRRASNEVEWPNIKPAERKTYSPLCTFGQAGMEAHPINCVSHEMAATYCKAQGKRLPTEAEWEYATRGPDGRVYPWGDDAPTSKHLNACGTECVAWGQKHGTPFSALYPEDDGYANTSPVGKFEAGRSRFGPYDVVGNVWEWVADWSAPYNADPKTNPTGPDTGEKKVIRGGAWNGSYTSWLRPSFRYAQDPGAYSYGIGFRCAKDL
jgi:formylglycine-generating enzyme required for sulfatase activity/serine/threonine protein kinase